MDPTGLTFPFNALDAPDSRSPTGASASQDFQITIAVFPRPADSRQTRPHNARRRGVNGTFNTMTGC
jgi:hypothetical protein